MNGSPDRRNSFVDFLVNACRQLFAIRFLLLLDFFPFRTFSKAGESLFVQFRLCSDMNNELNLFVVRPVGHFRHLFHVKRCVFCSLCSLVCIIKIDWPVYGVVLWNSSVQRKRNSKTSNHRCMNLNWLLVARLNWPTYIHHSIFLPIEWKKRQMKSRFVCSQ